MFLRPDEDDGTGGTLSGNKKNVYIILKIFKLLFDVSLPSFFLKFAIDRALEGKKYEKTDIGPSLERVMRYHIVRGKFEGVHPLLRKMGVSSIKIDLKKEEILFNFIWNDASHIWDEIDIEMAASPIFSEHSSSVKIIQFSEITFDQKINEKLMGLKAEKILLSKIQGDITSLLQNLQCEELVIESLSLSNRDTNHLVDALMTRVENLTLDSDSELDHQILSRYDGSGKCKEISINSTRSRTTRTWYQVNKDENICINLVSPDCT